MKKNIITIISIIIVIIVAFFVLTAKTNNTLAVITDKYQYIRDEALKLKIENSSKAFICFSSCYPYYLEKKDDNWQRFEYSECLDKNIAEKCLSKDKVKGFEISLPDLEKGDYRLAIPVCLSCQSLQEFKQEKWFYSNEFKIN